MRITEIHPTQKSGEKTVVRGVLKPKVVTNYVIALILFFTLFAVTTTVNANSSTPLSRYILALYDSQDEPSIESTRIHQFAEVILNHLGLVVQYHDIQQPLPNIAQETQFRGVITWFSSGQINNPNAWLQWTQQLLAANKRVVILGGIAGISDLDGQQTPQYQLNDTLGKIGLQHQYAWYPLTYDSKIINQDRSITAFERDYQTVLPAYPQIKAFGTQANSSLTVRNAQHMDTDSDLVIISDHGGYVAPGYALMSEPLLSGSPQHQWLINPFLFFSRSFNTRSLPKLDTTTLNGRRVFYSHSNADSWLEPSEIASYRAAGTPSIRVIIEQLIKPNSSLPFTVTLPLSALSTDKQPSLPSSIQQALNNTTNIHWALQIDSTSTIPTGPFKSPPLNASKLRIWDKPTPENLMAASEAGLINMVATSKRTPPYFFSYSTLEPLARSTGKTWAVYASNYDNQIHTAPPYRSAVDETAQWLATETPIRIKPLNFHFSLGDGVKQASLNQLIKQLKTQDAAETIPVTTDFFARSVLGFHSAQLHQLDKNKWQISQRGGLQTIRFDHASRLRVDFRQSQGVIGQRHHQGSLYIALDEKIADVVLTLENSPTINTPPKATASYLSIANWRVFDVSHDNDQVQFSTHGYGDGKITWKMMLPGSYQITLNDGTKQRIQQTQHTSPEGELFINIQHNFSADPAPIVVKISKHRSQ